MADKKASEKKSESLAERAEKDREEVLDGYTNFDESAPKAAESSNAEFDEADRFVNTEKTLPAERATFGRRTLITNHTMAGLPSDVHQALVASSQLRRNEAMAYRDIQALLDKYGMDEEAMPDEVYDHLSRELDELELAAEFDERARKLLEKYV